LLVVAAQKRVAVEVKVPQLLRAPSTAVGCDRLLKIVKAAVKGARTGTKGQLSRERPALLVIGGFHLAPSDVHDFQSAAAEYLRGATGAGKHAHLMGIGLLWFGSFPVHGPSGWTVTATLHMPVAVNPGYRGDIPFTTK